MVSAESKLYIVFEAVVSYEVPSRCFLKAMFGSVSELNELTTPKSTQRS